MKILVIEDDTTINQNIRDYLVQNGYIVETAFDGFIAEKLLKKESYDCIILDVNLPYKNGYDICREFRKSNVVTPVLMLTAFDELEDKVQGFDSGADDYLTKPFYTKELLVRVKSLLKRNNQMSVKNMQEEIVIEDMVIHQAHKTVTRNDVRIELTPREYQVLLKLALANGELVSKKELIKEIWGGSFDANTNTIEVYINFLRNKVDKPFDKQLIKTKVGFGYFLDI
jgi:DNA-binding response OmpR family regulator